MKIIKLLLIAFLLVPVISFAQDKPEDDGYKIIIDCTEGEEIIKGGGEQKCGWSDFIKQINKIITLLLYIAVLLSVISFIYAGFKMIFSGGNEEAVKSAKHIFWNVVVGLVLVYAAWLIVNFVLTSFGVPKEYRLLEYKDND